MTLAYPEESQIQNCQELCNCFFFISENSGF